LFSLRIDDQSRDFVGVTFASVHFVFLKSNFPTASLILSILVPRRLPLGRSPYTSEWLQRASIAFPLRCHSTASVLPGYILRPSRFHGYSFRSAKGHAYTVQVEDLQLQYQLIF
jgi:hypothetical protein